MKTGTMTARKRGSSEKSLHGTILLAGDERLRDFRSGFESLGFSVQDLNSPGGLDTVSNPTIFILNGPGYKSIKADLDEFFESCHYPPQVIQIESGGALPEPPNLSALLPADYTERQLMVAVREAHRTVSLRMENEKLRESIETGHSEMGKLIEIGISLSSERDIDRLLDKIIREACELTTADAGSIYIVDKDDSGEQVLRFSNTRSDSLNVDFKEFTIPIGPDSIAGYVALTGEPLILDDCYHIPSKYQFSINKSFDEQNHYRTKSMLAVAMQNQKDEVIGVIQLINRKPMPDLVLTSPEIAEQKVIPFDERSRGLIDALGSQAGVALENYRLYRDIENLFEGFVQASVTAIESRDPTTCGHSERVATLTENIARNVNRLDKGPLRELSFSPSQLKEIRYAALLHDFGKVGVREHVLLKAKKLYPEHLELIKRRFELAREIYLKESSRNKVELLLEAGRDHYLSQFQDLDKETQDKLETLDRYLSLIVQANEPSVLEDDKFSALQQIAGICVSGQDSDGFALLDQSEYRMLSIARGSLTEEERREIESHVTHTFNFLSKIPWTGDLKGIPEIAYGHHEKLDGTGYPRGMKATEILPQTRMMTISDIYDALTATDRPYKPAVPDGKALDILSEEAKKGKIDSELLKVFIEAKVYDLTGSAKG